MGTGGSSGVLWSGSGIVNGNILTSCIACSLSNLFVMNVIAY